MYRFETAGVLIVPTLNGSQFQMTPHFAVFLGRISNLSPFIGVLFRYKDIGIPMRSIIVARHIGDSRQIIDRERIRQICDDLNRADVSRAMTSVWNHWSEIPVENSKPFVSLGS